MSRLGLSCIILFCSFISITHAKDILFQKIELANPVPMEYSVSFEDMPLTRCSMKCASYPGCKIFHYGDDNKCYILNMAEKGLESINIRALHVDQHLEGRCNKQSGYQPFFGGIFCMKASSYRLERPDANATCEQDGGNLVILKQVGLYLKRTAMKMLTSQVYWTGLTRNTEGEMVWADGSNLDINIWTPGGPSNLECVYITLWSFTLFDQKCWVSYRFICEYPFMFTL